MQGKKRILVICFEGGRPAQASAIYDGNNLYIMEINEISGDPYTWMQTMIEDTEKKSRAGWVVMVEDRTASFPPPATPWNFDAVLEDGRTKMQTAFDWYFTLLGRGSIIFEPTLKKYQLKMGGENDLVYAKNDDKGRLVYCVNWAEFKSGHRALLMCVAGAVMEEPLSDRWMNEFVGYLPKAKKPKVWPVFRTMKNLIRNQQADLENRISELEARKNV